MSRRMLRSLKLRGSTLLAAVAGALALTMFTTVPASAMYVDDGPGAIGSGLNLDDPCPRGYACIWDVLIVVGNTQPEHRYYNYGSYNFVNEYGNHTVWNNQTGGARVQLCLGYNGTNCTVTLYPGQAAHGDLTPYNSIKLLP